MRRRDAAGLTMEPRALETLWRCPVCGATLTVTVFREDAQGIEAGVLRCACGAAYPVVRGIPRLFRDAWQCHREFVAAYAAQLAACDALPSQPADAPSPHDQLLHRTRESFGFQWTHFSEMSCDFKENFFHYVHPLTPAFFHGKRGLDAGCGFGRHLYNAAAVGAQMVGIDLSAAIDVSARNTAGLANVTLGQADIYHLPFAPAGFDFIYSLGVLHHLPDPEAAFQSLVRALRPGGTIAIWVYGKHRGPTRWLLEVARGVTVRLPHRWVKGLSWLIASCEWHGLIRPYRWLRRLRGVGPRIERRMLPRINVYAAYPFQVSYADWFDRLAAPIRFYYNAEELRGWMHRARLDDVQLSPTGNYGWRAMGIKRAAAEIAAPLRVALVMNTLAVGGVETNVCNLAAELVQRGHHVTIVSADGELRAKVEASGAKCLLIAAWWQRPWTWLTAARGLRRFLREESIDVVHVFSATGAAVTALARWGLPHCPPVLSAPGGLQESPAERLRSHLRLWMHTWGADAMLAISGEIERRLQRLRLPPHPPIFSFCHIVLDTKRFQPLNDRADRQRIREELRLPPEARLIGTIGACVPRKSHHLFLQAAARVAHAEPRAYFLIIGDGHLRPQLEQLARRLGIAARVRFTGVRHDIPELLSALEVYMRPGVVEGFAGITALEALGMGIPTVAFETEDVKVAVVHNETGLLVPRGDTRALAAAIVLLLRDPPRARALAVAGQRLVHERFAIAQVVTRLEGLYAEVRPAPPRPAEESRCYAPAS